MKTKINELVELQQKFKTFYGVDNLICGIDNNSVHVYSFKNLKKLAEDVGEELQEKSRLDPKYQTESFFYYEGIEFFAIH